MRIPRPRAPPDPVEQASVQGHPFRSQPLKRRQCRQPDSGIPAGKRGPQDLPCLRREGMESTAEGDSVQTRITISRPAKRPYGSGIGPAQVRIAPEKDAQCQGQFPHQGRIVPAALQARREDPGKHRGRQPPGTRVTPEVVSQRRRPLPEDVPDRAAVELQDALLEQSRTRSQDSRIGGGEDRGRQKAREDLRAPGHALRHQFLQQRRCQHDPRPQGGKGPSRAALYTGMGRRHERKNMGLRLERLPRPG